MQYAILGMCGVRWWIRGVSSKLCDHELLVKRDLELPLDVKTTGGNRTRTISLITE